MNKQYVGLARVSSREQEREGFSLEVQEEALHRYAAAQGGEIVKLFRIAETATKPLERRTFKELMAYARENAVNLAGVLFFKVDRAARNLFDYVELERLEVEHGLEVIYVAQPTENTPAGRMMRRTLANMASFYTEQQSLDVCDGLRRRVENGLFVNKAPYGYRNIRIDGRSLVEEDPEQGPKVKRLFELYAYGPHTIDSLQQQLADDGIAYTKCTPRFPRSKLHAMLRDRSYIGEVRYRDQWYPGTHTPLIDRTTWDRVQVKLGAKIYESHELLFANELITCAHCERPITGERKTKQTKSGERHYTYYRCSKYNAKGHPRTRVNESRLTQQVLDLFDKIRIKDEGIRTWFSEVLKARRSTNKKLMEDQKSELDRQLTLLRQQQDRLLNLRLQDEIDAVTFAAKNTELRDRIGQLEAQQQQSLLKTSSEHHLAEKAFELSQSLEEKWLTSNVRVKRQLLKIVCLNCTLNGATLCPTIRKPFDILAEGLISAKSRDDKI